MLIIRAVAVVLALLSVFPLWRMLPAHVTGIAGLATAQASDTYWSMIWNGVLLALIPGVIAALLFDPLELEKKLERLFTKLSALRSTPYAVWCALLATTLASLIALYVLRGVPTLIDSFAQLLHARYLAAGRLAGPVGSAQAFWHIQQTIVTPNGWVSQYPPGFAFLLAIGLKLHVVMLVGPLLNGVAVFFAVLIAEEVAPNRISARVAGLLCALSPFMLALSGAYMSHIPAAAFSVAALYFVLKNRPAWAGLFIGLLFTVRPLTAVVAGVVAVGYALAGKQHRQILTATLAAIPLIALISWYNQHFFGSPFRFGYEAALGPNGGLGWGIDPWGNTYGATEALAYTSAELNALSLFLLEIPLPLVALVGLHVGTSRTLPRSHVLTFTWAAALPLASLAYWHHGLFMGPRMLADVAPVWIMLVTISSFGLVQRIRADWLIAGKYAVRSFVTGALVFAAIAGVLFFGPQRVLSYSIPPEMENLLRAPKAKEPALMFVHGGWTSRIAMKLAARGMRLDSVETALRQNSTCAVHHFANGEVVKLDFVADARRTLRATEISPGNRIRVRPDERLDAECSAQVAADTPGVRDVTPYIWQGDLPGLPAGGALWVRDLGPQADSALARAHRNRAVWSVR